MQNLKGGLSLQLIKIWQALLIEWSKKKNSLKRLAVELIKNWMQSKKLLCIKLVRKIKNFLQNSQKSWKKR